MKARWATAQIDEARRREIAQEFAQEPAYAKANRTYPVVRIRKVELAGEDTADHVIEIDGLENGVLNAALAGASIHMNGLKFATVDLRFYAWVDAEVEGEIHAQGYVIEKADGTRLTKPSRARLVTPEETT